MKGRTKSRRPQHAAKEHLPDWLVKLATSDVNVQATSPYVTRGRLFKLSDPGNAQLYTDFSALNFASGASSLPVLKKLLNAGVEVFHVDALHAKVVLIDSKSFSIGSQNLTFKGRRNREASFVAGDDTPPDEVIGFFADLKRVAVIVSLEDILEMETQIKPLMTQFKVLKKAADEIDADVKTARQLREQKRREDEARRKALAEAQRLGEQAMRRAIVNAGNLFSKNSTSSRIIARVRRLENTSGDLWRPTTFTQSLVPENDENFLALFSAAGTVPKRLYRYLMINLNNGKLAYARLAKSRITYFASGLRPNEIFKFRTESFKVSIKFERDLKLLKSRNIVVDLEAEARGLGTVGSAEFAFSVGGLELQRVDVVPRYGFSTYEMTLATVEEALRSDDLEGFIRRWLTKPFKFERNHYGENAEQYFGAQATSQIEVRAIRFGEGVVFSAQQFPYRMRPVVIPDILRK